MSKMPRAIRQGIKVVSCAEYKNNFLFERVWTSEQEDTMCDHLRVPTCVVLRRCPAPSHPCCLAICAGGVPQTAVKFLCKRREEEITHKLSKFEEDRFGVRPGPVVWFVQVTHHVHSSLFNSALPGVQHQRAGKPVSLRGGRTVTIRTSWYLQLMVCSNKSGRRGVTISATLTLTELNVCTGRRRAVSSEFIAAPVSSRDSSKHQWACSMLVFPAGSPPCLTHDEVWYEKSPQSPPLFHWSFRSHHSASLKSPLNPKIAVEAIKADPLFRCL